MKRLSAAFALVLMVAASAVPALARDFVQDGAGVLNPATVQQLNTRIGNFNAQTHKEVLVVTVPSVTGGSLSDVRDAAERAFAQNQVNGVLIFVDKGDRKDYIIPDRAGVSAGWFTSDMLGSIRQSMESNFRNGDFDAGITAGVSGILNIYRSHLGSLQTGTAASSAARERSTSTANSGGGISMFWWIVIGLIAFLVIRSITRSMSGPRYYGGQQGPGGPPMAGGPGYGPGYGGGYYGGGGGGGFWSGLLGGLGGAWLGNELFRGGGGGMGSGGSFGGSDVGGGNAPTDAGGWGSDAGQADLGGSSGGDWGGGGFGDSGGGFGGGDSGGGGGDSGGGW